MSVEMDEEEIAEMQKKYARRELGTNVDRYKEPEPELDSEGACMRPERSKVYYVTHSYILVGEEIVEPEVDLSAFLERQRLSPQESSAPPPPEEDSEIDTSVASILPGRQGAPTQSKKGKVQQIEWDQSLEEMSREKAAAEAKWGEPCRSQDADLCH